MSRTDKTKPLWVRYAEHNPRPIHDHVYGDCDLPPSPTQDATDTRCQWGSPYTLVFSHTCCSGCQRRTCMKEWQGFVKTANRKERYAGRREAHLHVTGVVND
jgi:hypothetical protein